MELRRGKAISSAASDKTLRPCWLRNQEKDHDHHFKTCPVGRDCGGGHRIAGLGPVVRSGSRQRYAPIPAQNDTAAVRQSRGKIAARLNGLHAFAMVPRGAAGGNANDPALTGGGSAGYNEMLQRF
jgi:hypothetical protein